MLKVGQCRADGRRKEVTGKTKKGHGRGGEREGEDEGEREGKEREE